MILEYGGIGITYDDISSVEFGSSRSNTHPDKNLYGFKIKDQYIFLSHILILLGNIPIPKELSEEYPNLSQKEWTASIWVSGLILALFNITK